MNDEHHNTENMEEDSSDKPSLGKFLGLGFTLLALILIPGLIGNQLDHRLNHSIPWMTLIFCLLGISLGFYFVFKELKN